MPSKSACGAWLGSEAEWKGKFAPFSVFGAFDEAAKLLYFLVEGKQAQELVLDARNFQRDSLEFPKSR